MTTTPIPPAAGPDPDANHSPAVSGEQLAGPPVDFVLAGRAVSTGAHIAGLILAAQLDTVGTPRKLAMDLWPDVDPSLVQEIWDRAMVVGVRAGQLMGAPRFNRDKLARLQAEFVKAGHAAMGGMVGQPLSVAEMLPAHPADDEEGRER
ncbi:hypothetical protein [Streptomyces sp. NPDC047868]|uniref:hypothetical protein n=1 Tax=Streptomyces sp. NPDC047868 TaxID=3155480 RepID=UPI003455DAC6